MALYHEGREAREHYFLHRASLYIYEKGRLVWEAIASTFLDRLGNVFYDRDGVPFQGREEN